MCLNLPSIYSYIYTIFLLTDELIISNRVSDMSIHTVSQNDSIHVS